MAWDFAAEIHALSNFDADLSGTTNSTSGENLHLHTNQWLTDGAKEIINLLPDKLKAKCGTVSLVNETNGTTLDMDGKGEILHVTRENADAGYYTPCRQIPAMYGDLSNDSNNIIYYATATDPVYWIESNSSNASTLFIKPTPTDNQPAKVVHISYPTVAYTNTSIDNFPDEAEYLVVLYAAIKAATHELNRYVADENTELITPISTLIAKLQQDYSSGIQALISGEAAAVPQQAQQRRGR